MADEARQPHRAAVDQRHAPAPAEDAEHRVLLDDAQIAPQRELQPAGDRIARDGGDHRLVSSIRVGPIGPIAVSLRVVGAARAADRLEVGAGAEGAVRAPEHADPGLVVGIEGGEGRSEPSAVAGRRHCAPRAGR